jgi:hypothetical protein
MAAFLHPAQPSLSCIAGKQRLVDLRAHSCGHLDRITHAESAIGALQTAHDDAE